MSEQTVVDIEPALQLRSISRNADAQLRKAELRDVMASETLILATAVGEVIVQLLVRRERMKERRFLLIIMIGIAALVGVVRFMMRLV